MTSSVTSSPVQIRCKGILFDMDGILISSLESVERSWAKWCALRDVEFERARAILHGCRAIETVARLRPDLDSEEELKVIEAIEVADGEGVRILPGVCELIKALPENSWTVVTSATEHLARTRLEQAGVPVPARLVTADQVTWGKPHPEPFLAGAAMLGFAPDRCVVFEDSESGAQAGRAAGCTVIATTFSHTKESLSAAHYLIPDLTAVTAEALADREGVALHFTPLAN